MKIPKAPALICRSPASRKAWKEIWALLVKHNMAEELYAPLVMAMSIELGLIDEASNAIYCPKDPETGRKGKRTLEQYLAGRNSQTAQELTVLRDSLRQLAKLAAEFGSSPLAQKRIGSGKKKSEESPMMQYIRSANERMKRRVG